jgi:type IV pilus assembly protein PilY1
MYIDHKDANSKVGNSKKILSKAIVSIFAVLIFQAQAANNIFANIPLHLQSKSTTTTAFSIKPNIAFYIDDSGSMNDPMGYSCRYRTSTCRRLNSSTKKCANWEPYSPWSAENDRVDGIPDLGNLRDLIDDPDLPVEQHKRIDYGYCKRTTGEDGKTLNKMTMVQHVLSDILDKYKNDFYFSLQPMTRLDPLERDPKNPNNRIRPDYNRFYDTSTNDGYEFIRDHIIGNKTYDIRGLIPHGGTPTARRLNAVVRNTIINKLQYRCQKSYLILLTDGLDVGTVPITDSTKYAGNLTYGYDGYFDGDDYRPANVNGTAANIPHLLEYYTKTLATKSFGKYSYTKDFVTDNGGAYNTATNKFTDRRLTDDAGQPWDGPDPLAGEPGHSATFTQTAQTFTIGVGLGNKALTNMQQTAHTYLRNGASPKPNYDPITNPDAKYFFNANSKQQILDAFENIFQEIKGVTTTTTTNVTTAAPTVAVTGGTSADSAVTAIVDTGPWSSKICIHAKNDKSKTSCNRQPTYGNRQLLLNDGQDTYLYSSSLKKFDNNYFKIPNNNYQNNSEWLEGLLSWYARSKADSAIKKDDFVLDYRQRDKVDEKTRDESRRNIGDILDNPIRSIGDNVSVGTDETKYQKYMITSANDGMVYVFRATNDSSHPYDLKFNYMPMAIERQSNNGSDLVAHYYKDLTNNQYGRDSDHPHRYLLNGGFSVYETEKRKDAPSLIYMISNMGQAGRGAFAINIGGNDLISGAPIAADNMSSGNWYKDVFLFQTPIGANNQFGYTIGTPIASRVRVNKDVKASWTSVTDHIREAAFINNGYNYSDNMAQPVQQSPESALYVYDALGIDVGTAGYAKVGMKAGEQIAKLVGPGGSGGLSSPVAYDLDSDGVADLVYAGDFGGNLFRFDLRNPDPAKWTATKIFSAGAPITATPAIYEVENETAQNNSSTNKKLVIVFGTGSNIYQSDLNNNDEQAIYGIYDDPDETNNALIDKSSLLEQVMTYNGSKGQLSSFPFSQQRYKGWYFKLNNDGERVVTPVQQLLYAGIVVTRSYSVSGDNKPKDPCDITIVNESTNVYSRTTQFNALTGSALTRKDPHIHNDPELSSSVGEQGTVAYSFIGGGNPKVTSESGLRSPLIPPGGDRKQPPTCFRSKVGGSDNHGNSIGFEGIEMCPISFKRLSWREIKTNYM